ncbi:disulfide bond formation protein B [Salmonella enterica subsp. diarizonae]|uniref:Disulfide bond formation protein B n=1 Tax=Salmonella diarizonae TaxID=59204 RepID=A0A379TZR4_SALDZ|nr:disulfide bond formation protein B [Salmonella enterica subsp. diarizonae]
MLRFLNQCSRGRGAWLLMALTALALEMVALWFQHVMLLKPCVLCIYERCALFGVMGRGSGRRNSAENAAAIRGNGYLDLQRLAGSTTGV